MPLCLDFYVLHLHVYLIHERHQIPLEVNVDAATGEVVNVEAD
jgi:predicted small secreted protein